MEMVGYIYNADNMNQTFKAGDKLYVTPQDFAADGQLVIIQNGDAVEVKYFYHADGAYTLRDENPKYPPQRTTEPPQILGVVVGYERFFDPIRADLDRLSPEALELLEMAKDLPADKIRQVADFLAACNNE